MKEELLEHIFQNMDEGCLSDLRLQYVLEKYIADIMELDDQEYTLEEWIQLLNYVGCNCQHVQSVKEAKEQLCEWVKEK